MADIYLRFWWMGDYAKQGPAESLMERRKILRVTLVSAGVSALALLYFFVDARYNSFLPRCLFYMFTGLYCPGCGSQRAISSLLHGDVWQAINYNLLLVFSLPIVLYAAGIRIMNVFGPRQYRQRLFYKSWFTRLILVLVIVFGIARNIPFYPFNLLAPHPNN